MPCEAGHTVADPVRPDRAGGANSSASDALGRIHPPQAPVATAMDGVANPAMSNLAAYVPLSGKDLEALEALPQVVPKAGPGVELLGAGPGFRPASLR